jgi:hypothetical protein
MKRILLASLLVLASPLAAAYQELPSPGFQADAGINNPAPWSTFATMADGSRVHFDGATVTHHGADGTFLATLHAFSTFSFYGAIAADPSGDSLVVGESTNGDIFRVEMDGSGATYLANLPYNFDAAYDAPGSVVISAATCGFSCGNDIIRIDTLTGLTELVAQVSGPSGPVALSATGDLYYGPSLDAFPAPAGSGELWLFAASSLSGSGVLSDSDATVITTGLDIISSIAVDSAFGDVVVATNTYDSNFSVVADALTLLRYDGQVRGVIAEGLGSYRSNIDLVQGSGVGHFQAYQPSDVALTYSVGGRIETIKPQRPTAAVTHHGGSSYSFDVQGGEPGGAMLLTYGNSALHQGFESSYQLGFDFLFHTGLPINATRRVGQFLLPCDAAGNASFPFWNNGNLTGTVVFQGLMTDSFGSFVGSSEAAFN